jgi:hypothetical protein
MNFRVASEGMGMSEKNVHEEDESQKPWFSLSL